MNTNVESFSNLFQMFENRDLARSSTVWNNVIFPIVINTICHNIVYGNTIARAYILCTCKIKNNMVYVHKIEDHHARSIINLSQLV